MTTETNHNHNHSPDIGTEPGANWTFLEGHAHDEGLDPQPAHDDLPGQDSGRSEPPAAAAEQDTVAQQESRPAPAAAPVMPHDSGDALLTDEVESELFSRWTAIQNSFVEDPRTSVEDADALIQEIVATLTASLRERTNELAAAWQHGQPDTEQLRLALRQYRSFVGVVLPR